MANDSKRGFFSSLFGRRKRNEHQETEELESRHRLEERIRLILAEKVADVPKVVVEETQTALMIPEAEVEPEIELLPISASVLSRRKAPIPAAFMPPVVEVGRSYAASGR